MDDIVSLGGKVQLNPTLDFIAGTIAGMASLVVGFPLDTVKVRFQSPTLSRKYKSTFQTIVTILREEGLIGLYRGITSPLAVVALMNGLTFALYHFFKRIQMVDTDAVPTLAQVALAGAGTGIVSALVTTPIELIKIRQQLLVTPTAAHLVAWRIVCDDGFLGLWRGLVPTALRDSGYGAYFLTYEATCRLLRSSNGEPLAAPALLLAGGAAGIAAWIFTFPFDVVKTRMQASLPIYSSVPNEGSDGHPSPFQGHEAASTSTPLLPQLESIDPPQDLNPYRSTWSTIMNAYRADGIGVFYRGLAPTLIRAIPVNMVVFITFEAVVAVFA